MMRIRRVLVALESESRGSESLEAAADVAERARAELVGLFVEDLDLLRLSGLPFAAEIGSVSGQAAELRTEEVERRMRGFAEKWRAAVEAVAARRSVRHGFLISRGSVSSELAAQAGSNDLVVVWWKKREFHLGPEVREWRCRLQGRCGGPVLFLCEERRPARRVSAGCSAVLLADSETAVSDAQEALGTLDVLGWPREVVFLAAGTGEAVEAAAGTLRELADGLGFRAEVEAVVPGDWRRVAEALRRRGARCLLVSGGGGGEKGFDRFLDEAHCPVLVLGRRGDPGGGSGKASEA